MVNKSGDMMTGNLVLNSHSFKTKGTLGRILEAKDSNGAELSTFETNRNSDTKAQTILFAFNPSDSSKNVTLNVVYDGNSGYALAPASNINNSILTTVAHGDNYVKLGNRLILQWGIIEVNLGSSGAYYNNIVLPTPFSDVNYCIFTNITARTSDYTSGISSKQPVSALMTTTGFKITVNIGCVMTWFAIGW